MIGTLLMATLGGLIGAFVVLAVQKYNSPTARAHRFFNKSSSGILPIGAAKNDVIPTWQGQMVSAKKRSKKKAAKKKSAPVMRNGIFSLADDKPKRKRRTKAEMMAANADNLKEGVF